MGDYAFVDGQLAHRHFPFIGGGLQQHHAGTRAGAPHIILRSAYAAAPAGGHVAPNALVRKVLPGINMLGLDLVPVAIELFGHQLRESGERALPHFGTCNADHHRVVRLDHHPGVKLRRARRNSLRMGIIGHTVQIKAQRESAAHDRGFHNKVAACRILEIRVCHIVHVMSPVTPQCVRWP